MSKPVSSVSTAVSIRISNDLLDAVKEYAIANNLINNFGRPDKRGEPNLSQAFSELVKVALGKPLTLSDSVSNTASNDLTDTVKKLSDSVITLSDRLVNIESAIANIKTSETTAPKKVKPLVSIAA